MWLLGLCILVFGSDLKKFWANYLCRNVGFKVFAGSEGAWLSWLQLLHVQGLVLTLRLGYLNPCRQYSWGACACVRGAEEINMLKILRCLQSDALATVTTEFLRYQSSLVTQAHCPLLRFCRRAEV